MCKLQENMILFQLLYIGRPSTKNLHNKVIYNIKAEQNNKQVKKA